MKKLVAIAIVAAALASCQNNTNWQEELAGGSYQVTLNTDSMEPEAAAMAQMVLGSLTVEFTETTIVEPFGDEIEITYTGSGYRVNESGNEIGLKKVSEGVYEFVSDDMPEDFPFAGFKAVTND